MRQTGLVSIKLADVAADGPGFPEACALFDDYRAHYGAERSPDRVREWLGEQISTDRLAMVLAVQAELPCGFVTAAAAPASLRLGTAWLVRDLWVDPAHRNAGIARTLVSHVIDVARAQGALRVGVQTEPGNDAALSLYRSLGFAEITGLSVLGFDLSGQR